MRRTIEREGGAAAAKVSVRATPPRESGAGVRYFDDNRWDTAMIYLMHDHTMLMHELLLKWSGERKR
jgi:hypothetical protein